MIGALPVSNLSRSTRIVTDRAGLQNEAVQTRRVPKKWLNHERAVRRINKKVGRTVQNKEFVKSIYIGGASKSTDGLLYAQLVIEVNEKATESQVDALPRSIEEAGVSAPADMEFTDIRIERTEGEYKKACANGNFANDPYPGGIYIESPNTVGRGTSGYRMTDGSQEYIISAAHNFASCEIDTSVKARAHHGGDGTYPEIGTVADGHKVHDWALIEPSSTDIDDIEKKIWHGEGNNESDGAKTTVGAYKTKDGLSAIKGQTVWKQGTTTGYEGGTFKGYSSNANNLGCIRMDWGGARAAINTAKGDSGGPMWDYVMKDGSEVASVITQIALRTGSVIASCNGTDVYEYGVGWPTFRIVNNTGYRINK